MTAARVWTESELRAYIMWTRLALAMPLCENDRRIGEDGA